MGIILCCTHFSWPYITPQCTDLTLATNTSTYIWYPKTAVENKIPCPSNNTFLHFTPLCSWTTSAHHANFYNLEQDLINNTATTYCTTIWFTHSNRHNRYFSHPQQHFTLSCHPVHLEDGFYQSYQNWLRRSWMGTLLTWQSSTLNIWKNYANVTGPAKMDQVGL